MEFDQFSVVLFERNPDAPRLDEKIGRALRDAHLARVAQLHEVRYVLAAGPFLADASEQIEALVILKVEPLEAQGIIGLRSDRTGPTMDVQSIALDGSKGCDEFQSNPFSTYS